MPPRGLPGNANLEQLKKGAKSFQRAVRAGDTGVARVVNELHPRFSEAQPGSSELRGCTRTDAQLVIARQFGFSSWPRLACLTDGDDDPDRFGRAQALLEQHEWRARASLHTIAATGDLEAAREVLDRDGVPSLAGRRPTRVGAAAYLTYSRAPLGPGRSAVAVARLLLEHGADPNTGYLWEGLIPPFTALIAAAGHGLTDRVRHLLARGVDPEGRELKHPIYQGGSPVQEAARAGHMDIVARLVDAGSS